MLALPTATPVALYKAVLAPQMAALQQHLPPTVVQPMAQLLLLLLLAQQLVAQVLVQVQE